MKILELEIKIDNNAINKAKNLLANTPGAFDRASKRAIRRALEGMRTIITSKTHELYYAKSGLVRGSMSVKYSNTSGQIISRGTRLGLEKYKISPARPGKRKKNFSGAVKRAGGLKAFPKGFLISPGKNGKYFPYIRTGPDRWDIEKIISPAIPQIIGNEEIVNEINSRVSKIFTERLNHEVMRELGVFAR